MSETAYIITSGEYSDYRVHSVYTSREIAEQALATLNGRASGSFDARDGGWRFSYGDEYGIEEYALNEPIEVEMGCYTARCSINGWNGETYISWDTRHTATETATAERDPYRSGAINIAGYGETREHARRSAEELRRAIIAGTVVLP